MELERMTLEELRRHRAAVDRAIAGYEERKRKEALARLDDVAKELGYPSAAVVVTAKPGPKGRGSTSSAPVRYQNPDDRSQTWAGIGRRPKWFVEALARGRSEAELKI